LKLEVGADQIVRLPGKPNFAGSALRPIEGVFRAAHMLQRPWQEAWTRFSAAPAGFMGLTAADLKAGGAATFWLVSVSAENEFQSIQMILNEEPKPRSGVA